MLQKIKYETLNYGRYDKLRRKFISSDFDPEECKVLELSHQHATELPTQKCLEIVKNLQILKLSHNQIQRFDATILIKGCPQLEILDLSNNKIDILDDIIELGSLHNLGALDFQYNPISNRLSRINLIKELLYPEKYKKYDPVKILTVGYEAMPLTRLSREEEEQMKKDLEINELFYEELDPRETKQLVSKYGHKNTLAKYAVQKCPVPRKSRFKNLIILNGQDITKLDVMRASGKDKINEIIEDVNEQEIKPKKIQRPNEETHRKYIQKYIKKIHRLQEENMSTNIRNIKQSGDGIGGDEDLKYLSKLDEALQKGSKFVIDPKIYAADIWQTPLDIQYKNSTFSISIKEYKKIMQEYEIQKKQKLENKKQQYIDRQNSRKSRVHAKLQKAGIEPVTKEELERYEELGCKFENIEDLFKIKSKKERMKHDLDRLEERKYRSSESELSEEFEKQIRNESFSQDMKYSKEDEENPQENVQEDKGKSKTKKQTYINQDVDVLELKRKLEDNNKQKKQALSQKQPYSQNAEIQRKQQRNKEMLKQQKKIQEKEEQEDEKSQKKENENNNEKQKPNDDSYQSMHKIELNPQEKNKSQFQEQQQQTQQQNLNSFQKQDDDIDNIGIEAVQVSRYDFRVNKKSNEIEKRIHAQNIKNEIQKSFSITNKIFSKHNEQKEQLAQQISRKTSGKVGKKHSLHRNRSSSSSLSERNSKGGESQKESFIQKQKYEQKDKKGTHYPMTKPKNKEYKSQKTLNRGNNKLMKQMTEGPQKISRSEFKADKLIPTVEQGMDPNIRNQALFNPENELYQQLQKFTQKLEEFNNLRQSLSNLDRKLEEHNIGKRPAEKFNQYIKYDDVFKFLKETVKDFKIQNSYDLANYLQHKFGKRMQSLPQKMSAFELNTIINKVNDINRKNASRISEKEINEQLRNDPNMDFKLRELLYDQLDTLEEIKLKKMKVSQEHLRRLEKKEIERAEHNARLAYHYYKLRNFIDDGNLEKYLKRLNLGLDGQNNQGRLQFKKKTVKKNQNMDYDENNVPNYFNKQKLKNLEQQLKKEPKGFVGKLEELLKLKKQAYPAREIPECNLSGFIVEKYPDINEWANSRLYVPQPKLTFEDLMEQHERKIKEEFQKSRNNQVLSIEEQMMKYAQEFKEKEQERYDLRKRIEGYVKDGKKVLNEFMDQEFYEIDKRFDVNHCFGEYIKLMREGKLPKRIHKSNIKKNN